MTPRRAVTLYCAVLLAPLIAVATIAAVIDPYSVFRSPITRFNHVKVYDPPQQNAVFRAELKALDLIRDKPSRIILGSSVADGGFPLWTDKAGSSTTPIYNTAVRGANLATLERYLHHAHLNNPKLTEVFFSVDWLFFSWQNKPCCKPELEPAILVHRHVPVWHYLEKLQGWATLRDSLHVVNNSTGGRLEQRLRRLVPRAAAAREHSVALSLTARSGPEIQRFVTLEQFARQWSVRSHADYLNEDAFAALARIVRFCRERGIELHLFMTPTEATFWAAARRAGIWPAYQEALRRIAAIHPFWDFAALIDHQAKDADVIFGGDLWHYQPPAGEIILRKVLQGRHRGEKEGLYVTPKTIDAHLKERDRLLSEWIAQNPYQSQFVNAIPLGRDFAGSVNMLRIVEPNYRCFTLSRQADHGYAFPVKGGSYDIVALKTGQIPGVFSVDLENIAASEAGRAKTVPVYEAALDRLAAKELRKVLDRHVPQPDGGCG